MGRIAIYISISSIKHLRKIQKWSQILTLAYCKFISINTSKPPSTEHVQACLKKEFNWNNHLKTFNQQPILPILSDAILSPCGFKYYCGKLWLTISTGHPGIEIVLALSQYSIITKYTFNLGLPEEFHEVPTHTIKNCSWLESEKTYFELKKTRKCIPNKEYELSNIIDFKAYKEKNLEKYLELLKLSDSSIFLPLIKKETCTNPINVINSINSTYTKPKYEAFGQMDEQNMIETSVTNTIVSTSVTNNSGDFSIFNLW